MVTMLAGNGKFDFRIHTGRIEYKDVVDYVGPVPVEGLSMECVAVVVLDDGHLIDSGNGVGAGVMLKGPKTVPAGWFQWKQARQYRKEIAALGIAPDEPMLCLGKLCGGAEMQFRKGPKRMHLNLRLDLSWPISVREDWYIACEPYFSKLA